MIFQLCTDSSVRIFESNLITLCLLWMDGIQILRDSYLEHLRDSLSSISLFCRYKIRPLISLDKNEEKGPPSDEDCKTAAPCQALNIRYHPVVVVVQGIPYGYGGLQAANTVAMFL